MANSNCLVGMKCPVCFSEGPFRIVMSSWFDLYDDGTDGHGDTDWDDDSNCQCKNCTHTGRVSIFRPNIRAALRRGMAREELGNGTNRVFIQEETPKPGQDDVYVKAWIEVPRELPGAFVTEEGKTFDLFLDEACWRNRHRMTAEGDTGFDHYGRPVDEDGKPLAGSFMY